jgi:spore photoproduct lyase
MNESGYSPRKIYIDKKSLHFPLTQRIIKNTGSIPKETIEDPHLLIEDLKTGKDPIGEGKKYLFLTVQKGDFVKPCPCTPRYIGCNYFVINSELNCPLDCSYCILQDYLSNPLITIHVNLEDLWKELDGFLKKRKGRPFRVGTGELGDSLALDHITESSKDFIRYFRKNKHAFFELKTKTTNMNNILSQEPAQNIIVSWSLNTPKIVREQERGAPPVEDRIEAARQVVEKGFPVGFHFDPLIRYPGWKEDYKAVIERLLRGIDPARVAWISLGSLRFSPHFKSIIKERFPREKIFCDEFIKGKDGKYRYFRPLRLELYREVLESIRKNGGEAVPLYFCMENKDVWQEVLGWVPRSEREVEGSLLPRGNIK